MNGSDKGKLNRRDFIKHLSALGTGALVTGLGAGWAHSKTKSRASGRRQKRVIVIGIDGMDPRLSEKMMDAGRLPYLDRLRKGGGFKRLGTSIPPQSPVAWASFINGAGPASHGIFDFIHRHPEKQCEPFFAAAEAIPGEGYLEIGDHKLQLDFWPFSHKPPVTELGRQGVPLWDYLDEEGISSTFYDLPSNYPPSPSKYGRHRCLSGLGTPDMLGTYGTYQSFSEDGPDRVINEGGGKRAKIVFKNESASIELVGPENRFLREPRPVKIRFYVHRDRRGGAAVIEIQNHKLLLKEGQWSRWIKLNYRMSMPPFMPDENINGICRFYLQETSPNFRLYVTPINIDPSNPAVQISEPNSFCKDISGKLGLFYTTGFQEDHKALSNRIFDEREFIFQSGIVLQERLNLLKYAMEDYDDGLLFFYFSSIDLQGHMLWWDSDEKHPARSAAEARRCFNHLKNIYVKMDEVVGHILKRYGDRATILVMSDHGFANFKRQFNLNTWLRDNGYIRPADCSSILSDVDWSRTKAYGLGINGLYVNLKGRERDGIVEPGREQEELLRRLISELEAITDSNGRRIIHKVHRADEAYGAPNIGLAPDLILGYARDYRAAWATCLGDMGPAVLLDNHSAWGADHCADVSQVPGILFCNRPIRNHAPTLIDMAPTILTAFGLKIPSTMQGKNIL